MNEKRALHSGQRVSILAHRLMHATQNTCAHESKRPRRETSSWHIAHWSPKKGKDARGASASASASDAGAGAGEDEATIGAASSSGGGARSSAAVASVVGFGFCAASSAARTLGLMASPRRHDARARRRRRRSRAEDLVASMTASATKLNIKILWQLLKKTRVRRRNEPSARARRRASVHGETRSRVNNIKTG